MKETAITRLLRAREVIPEKCRNNNFPQDQSLSEGGNHINRELLSSTLNLDIRKKYIVRILYMQEYFVKSNLYRFIVLF
jgi:hypothetical protein